MSASTKRKNRQAEIEAGTYRKQVTQRERDQKKAKEKRTIVICTAIVAVIVVAAILLNLIPAIKNKQELRRYTDGVAVTVGDRTYSPAEVGYYYRNQFNNFAGSYYGMIYGLDASKGATGLGSMAYTGPELEGEDLATWRDYFLRSVYNSLVTTQTWLGYARDNNITLDAEEIDAVDEDLANYKAYAVMYNYPDVDQFLSMNLGKGVTLDMIRNLELDSALATKAQDAFKDQLSFTQEELDAEYAGFGGVYDEFSYAYYCVSPKAAEGEEPTDMAKAEANAEADAIVASYQDGYDVEDPFERLNGYIEEELGDTASRTDSLKGSYVTDVYAEWLLDEARQPGDITKIADGNDYHVVVFLGRETAAYPTVNVRHILIQAEASEDGTWSEEALAAAQAEAQRILAEFEAGDKTEESFAALAEQYSQDEGSKDKGGLYENVYKGQTVAEFNDFCFAEGRQSGDTAIVYGSNGQYAGFHVMYFVGYGENYSDLLAKDSLSQNAVLELLSGAGVAYTPGPEEVLVDPVTEPVAAEPEEKTEG